MESIKSTKMAALENVEKDIEFCRKYRVLLGDDLKYCIYCNVVYSLIRGDSNLGL